jgi:hypothetical protein
MAEAAFVLDTAQANHAVSAASSIKDASSALSTASRRALRWLDARPVPSGHERSSAELRAAAGVFRNAALLARRRLTSRTSKVDVGQLISQGQSHVSEALSEIESS